MARICRRCNICKFLYARSSTWEKLSRKVWQFPSKAMGGAGSGLFDNNVRETRTLA